MIIGLHTTSMAQDYYTRENAPKKALKLLQKGDQLVRLNPLTAIEYYTKAINKEPRFVDAYLMRADLYYVQKEFALSEQDFQKVLEIAPDFDVKIFYILAVTQYEQDKYEEAGANLRIFLEKNYDNQRLIRKAEGLLATCEFAAESIKNAPDIEYHNLGENINTPMPEYLPTLTADGQTLIFTRRVGRQEDFYISELKDSTWSPAANLGPPINTYENEGAETISADGRTLVYTVCNRREDYGSCDLYISEFNKKTQNWSKPRNMGRPVNSAAWESQPSLSADGLTLYFTSSRNKNKDIFVSRRAYKGARWSVPEKLGFNTADSEEGPFIHADGQTMYFSSTGYVGMGKADLFVTRQQPDGSWSEPQNLGYPINTKSHEGALIVSLDGKTAYFASDQAGGFGAVDLYSFELPPSLRPLPVTYARILIYDAATKEPLVASSTVIDLETDSVLFSSKGYDDGEELICLPLQRNYSLNVRKQGYLFHSENFALKTENSQAEPFIIKVYLQKVPVPSSQPIASAQPKVVSKPVVLKNVFFKTGSAELVSTSKTELQQLVALLSENPTMQMQINGHTDNVGADMDNLRLSEARANAVVDYLVENGIDRQRLRAKGFGETQPVADNQSAAGRQLNRRTEFVVIQ